MKKQILILGVILALIVASLPAVGAQDAPASGFSWWTACEEDLTGETIPFYHFGDLSGTYAFITQPFIAGFTDAVNYVNENGGICGATVEQVYEDTAGEQERAQAAWDKYSAEEDAYSIYIYASADGELLREQANEAEIVLFNAAGSELALYGEDGEGGYQFSFIPLYTDQIGAFCDYVAVPENREALGIEGDPKIGHLTWPNAFGRASDTPATKAYCESKGVAVIEETQVFLPSVSDLTSLIQILLDEGANIIYTTTLASGPANIATSLASMNLENAPVVAGPNWVLDTSVIGLGQQNAFGIVGNLPYVWWDEIEGNAGIQLVNQIWAEKQLVPAGDDSDAVRTALGRRGIAYLGAFFWIDIWGEALIQTINRVGYENLSGAALYETLDNFEYGALQGAQPIDWTNGSRASHMTRIGSIQLVEEGGNQVPKILPLAVPEGQDVWVLAPDLRAIGGADVPQ